MQYAWFWGCIAPLRYPGIESSSRALMGRLNVKVDDIEGLSCCPAPGLFRKLNEKTWLSLSARNLTLAEEKGYDLVTICNGCLMTLEETNRALKNSVKLMEEVNGVLATVGRTFKGNTNVHHIVDVLYDSVGVKRIKREVINPLEGLKVAIHYGCHYLRELNTRKGSLRGLKRVDELVKATGAEVIGYEGMEMCCGAGEGMRSSVPGIASRVTLQKLEYISKVGVGCIVNICPFCHLQLDLGQAEIERKLNKGFNIPVLNYSQLLCLSFGIPHSLLGFEGHAVSPKRLLEKL